MNKFILGERVVNKYKNHFGTIVAVADVVTQKKETYTVKWDDGSKTLHQEGEGLTPEKAMPKLEDKTCLRCNAVTEHNVNRTLGRVFYRCVRCGGRNSA